MWIGPFSTRFICKVLLYNHVERILLALFKWPHLLANYDFHGTCFHLQITSLKSLIESRSFRSWSFLAKWLRVQIKLLSLRLLIWGLLRVTRSLTFRQTKECRSTLKLVCDMIKIYSQMQRADRYSQHSSINWPLWVNSRVFVYKVGHCELETCHFHWNFRYSTWFIKGVLWHSGKLLSVDSLWNSYVTW